MPIYLFTSDSYHISAFTPDPTGGNLPADYIPWRLVNAGKTIPIENTAAAILTSIAQKGFFLRSGGARNS
jgi:hypothetical protein